MAFEGQILTAKLSVLPVKKGRLLTYSAKLTLYRKTLNKSGFSISFSSLCLCLAPGFFAHLANVANKVHQNLLEPVTAVGTRLL